MVTKKAAPRKKATNKVIVAEYVATLRIFGRTFNETGATPQEAIAALKPGIARGRAILTITGPTTSQERVISPIVVARLFQAGGMTREIAVIQVAKLFAL